MVQTNRVHVSKFCHHTYTTTGCLLDPIQMGHWTNQKSEPITTQNSTTQCVQLRSTESHTQRDNVAYVPTFRSQH